MGHGINKSINLSIHISYTEDAVSTYSDVGTSTYSDNYISPGEISYDILRAANDIACDIDITRDIVSFFE